MSGTRPLTLKEETEAARQARPPEDGQPGPAGWLAAEAGRWRRIFLGPAWAVLLLAAGLGLALAWQAPFSYTLDAGNELHLDQPFLRNFNAVESRPDEAGQSRVYFRWSKNEGSWDFAGIGRQPYRLQLTLEPGINPDSRYTLLANGREIGAGRLEAGMAAYRFEVPADIISNRDGNLRLTLKMGGFTPPGDPRSLGFVFYSLRLEGAPAGPVIPPPAHLGWLLGLIGLAYTLLARAGFGNWTAAGATLGLGLLPAGIVASGARPWLTIYSPTLTMIFGLALLLTWLAGLALRNCGPYRKWALAIFGLALALRLAGVLHPHTSNSVGIIDIGFHINHYADLWDHGRWFIKIQSGEWGNRETYYPLTSYLLIGLFQWLTPDRRLLILLVTVALESSRVLLVFWLVWRATGRGRAAALAAFLMAALPVNNLSLAWGQSANLVGEWLLLAALALAVVKWDDLGRPGPFVWLTAFLLASFVVHPGVVLLSGLAFLGLAAVMAWRKEGRRGAKIFGIIYLLAVLLAFVVYHRVTVLEMLPQALESLDAKLRGAPPPVAQTVRPAPPGWRVGGQVADARLGLPVTYVQSLDQLAIEGIKGFWREVRVYFQVVPLLGLPWGLWLLRRAVSPAGRRLYLAGLVWCGTAGLFALTGLLLNLYVRYSLFALPVVAIAAGFALDRLWRRLEGQSRGWLGAGLAAALGLWLALGTLALYYDRLVYYGHG